MHFEKDSEDAMKALRSESGCENEWNIYSAFIQKLLKSFTSSFVQPTEVNFSD